MDTTKLPAVEGFTPEELLKALSDEVGTDEADILDYVRDVITRCSCCNRVFMDWAELVNRKAVEFRQVDHISGWVCEHCHPEEDEDYQFNANYDEAEHHSTWRL